MTTSLILITHPLGTGLEAFAVIGFPPSYDDQNIVSLQLFWYAIELGVGLFVACIPACRKWVELVASKAASLASAISMSSMRKDSKGSVEDGLPMTRPTINISDSAFHPESSHPSGFAKPSRFGHSGALISHHTATAEKVEDSQRQTHADDFIGVSTEVVCQAENKLPV